MSLAENRTVIQALALEGFDKSFREGVAVWLPRGSGLPRGRGPRGISVRFDISDAEQRMLWGMLVTIAL